MAATTAQRSSTAATQTPIELQSNPSLPPPSVSSELAKLGAPRGYPQVANFMGDYPEMAMVRRFRGLNSRNLLYLQAELVQIEKELIQLEKTDETTNPEYARDFFWLMESADKEGDVQWQLIQKMRGKLKEYNKVLIQQTTLAQVSNPSKYDAKQVENWFKREGMPLTGDDDSIWAKPGRLQDGDGVSRHIPDLIAINGQTSEYDQATRWLAEKFIPSWDKKPWGQSNRGIKTYPERILYNFTSIVATVLSSLLPVLSIVVLYLVHNMPVRLGIIAGFTAGFSIVLSIITSASRIDTFAATAAFAAVQVVFVGSSGNSTSGG